MISAEANAPKLQELTTIVRTFAVNLSLVSDNSLQFSLQITHDLSGSLRPFLLRAFPVFSHLKRFFLSFERLRLLFCLCAALSHSARGSMIDEPGPRFKCSIGRERREPLHVSVFAATKRASCKLTPKQVSLSHFFFSL